MVSGTRMMLQSVGFLAVEKGDTRSVPAGVVRRDVCETADQVVEK